MKKAVIALPGCLVLGVAIIVTLLGINKINRNVLIYKYDNSKSGVGITIDRSEYSDDKLVIYGSGFDAYMEVSACYDNRLNSIDETYDYNVSNKKITISIENAKRISGIYMQAGDLEYRIRYLDTNQYAMIWSEFVCDVGYEEKGNIEAYYTRQELAAKQTALNVANKKLADNFSIIEGNWESQKAFLSFRKEDENFYFMESTIGNHEARISKEPIVEISINENTDGSIKAEIVCSGGSEQRRAEFILYSDGTICDKYAMDITYSRTDMPIEQWQENINQLYSVNEKLKEDLALISEYSLAPVELGATTDLSGKNQLNYSQDMPYTFYNYNPEEGMDIENFEASGYYYGGELRCTTIDTTNPNIEIMMLHTGINIDAAKESMVDFFEYEVHEPVSSPIEGEFVEFTHNLVHVICFIDSDTGEIRRIMAYLDNQVDYVE